MQKPLVATMCLDSGRQEHRADHVRQADRTPRRPRCDEGHRPAQVGNFAQNIHEYQSLGTFSRLELRVTMLSDLTLPITLLIHQLVMVIHDGHLVCIPMLAFNLSMGCLIGYSMLRSRWCQPAGTHAVAGLLTRYQSRLLETLTWVDAMKVNNAASERQYQ
ncbi:hypothetical protein [Pseudomonas glycinae]|uniref:Uncharacterized protein n=1 Tax=Pseudomonas glycinae TaxID=1785145 RepID=A0ABM6QI14_9PSED|nr:hypothetical protein [Pseudomonas glycinae]AUG97608.1 hypothetical protein AWU82_29800 [Pseudomonas glycinae]